MTNAEATEIRLKGLVLGAGAMGGGLWRNGRRGQGSAKGPSEAELPVGRAGWWWAGV